MAWPRRKSLGFVTPSGGQMSRADVCNTRTFEACAKAASTYGSSTCTETVALHITLSRRIRESIPTVADFRSGSLTGSRNPVPQFLAVLNVVCNDCPGMALLSARREPLSEKARVSPGTNGQALLGMPCARCRLYYAASLQACPVCKSTERVPIPLMASPHVAD